MTPDPSTLIDHNPMQQFQKWFYEADDLYDEREPNAISLTTIGTVKYPKSSMVLLKKYTWKDLFSLLTMKAIKEKPLVPIQKFASYLKSFHLKEDYSWSKETPIHLNIY